MSFFSKFEIFLGGFCTLVLNTRFPHSLSPHWHILVILLFFCSSVRNLSIHAEIIPIKCLHLLVASSATSTSLKIPPYFRRNFFYYYPFLLLKFIFISLHASLHISPLNIFCDSNFFLFCGCKS